MPYRLLKQIGPVLFVDLVKGRVVELLPAAKRLLFFFRGRPSVSRCFGRQGTLRFPAGDHVASSGLGRTATARRPGTESKKVPALGRGHSAQGVGRSLPRPTLLPWQAHLEPALASSDPGERQTTLCRCCLAVDFSAHVSERAGRPAGVVR